MQGDSRQNTENTNINLLNDSLFEAGPCHGISFIGIIISNFRFNKYGLNVINYFKKMKGTLRAIIMESSCTHKISSDCL